MPLSLAAAAVLGLDLLHLLLHIYCMSLYRVSICCYLLYGELSFDRHMSCCVVRPPVVVLFGCIELKSNVRSHLEMTVENSLRDSCKVANVNTGRGRQCVWQ